jgi:hypothetical protein
VGIGLPLLDAMLPAGACRAAGAVEAGAPKRMILILRRLGTYGPYFTSSRPRTGLKYETIRCSSR